MAFQEELNSALSQMPKEFKEKFKTLDNEQRKVVVDNIAKQVSSKMQKSDGQTKDRSANDPRGLFAKPSADVERNLQRQESRMRYRPDMLTEGVDEIKRQGLGYMANPLNIGNNLKVVGGLAQRATASAVNPMIEAQRQPSFGKMTQAMIDPRVYGEQIKRGLTGERLGEVGDLITGAGGSGAQSATGGLALEAMLTAPRALIGAPKALWSAPGNISKFAKSAYEAIPAVKNYRAASMRLAQNEKLARGVEKNLENLHKEAAKIEKGIESLSTRLGDRGKSLSYKASKSVVDEVSRGFDYAKQNYASAIDNTKDARLKLGDANRIIQDIIVDSNIRNKTILDDAEKALLELEQTFAGKIKQSGEVRLPSGQNVFTKVEVTNPGLDSSEIKTFKNIVRSAIKSRPDVEAKFYKLFGEALEANGMSDLSDANKIYSRAYDLAEQAKELRRTKFSQISSGKIKSGSDEFLDIVRSEKSYGSNYSEQAAELYKKYTKAQSELAKRKGVVLDNKEMNKRFLEYLKESAKGHKKKIDFYNDLKEKAIKTGLIATVGSAVTGAGALAYNALKNR